MLVILKEHAVNGDSPFTIGTVTLSEGQTVEKLKKDIDECWEVLEDEMTNTDPFPNAIDLLQKLEARGYDIQHNQPQEIFIR